MARDKVAILAALSLASELQEKSERLSGVQGEQEQRIDALLSKIDDQLVRTSRLVS